MQINQILIKNVPTNLNILKYKVDKLDVGQSVPVPIDLSKLRNVVKMMLLKKMYIMLKSKMLTKYLTLLTQLLSLLLTPQ